MPAFHSLTPEANSSAPEASEAPKPQRGAVVSPMRREQNMTWLTDLEDEYS